MAFPIAFLTALNFSVTPFFIKLTALLIPSLIALNFSEIAFLIFSKMFLTASPNLAAFSFISSQFLYSKTPIAITAAIAATTIPIGEAIAAITDPRAGSAAMIPLIIGIIAPIADVIVPTTEITVPIVETSPPIMEIAGPIAATISPIFTIRS